MNRKTLIQFTHLGEQIACFILSCLFARASYELNCNSVCMSRCSIHLIRKISKLQQRQRFCWVDCLGRLETNCLLVTRFHYWLGSWNDSAAKMKDIVSPSNLHLNVWQMSNLLAALQKSPENVKSFLTLASNSRLPTSYECLTKKSQIQEC